MRRVGPSKPVLDGLHRPRAAARVAGGERTYAEQCVQASRLAIASFTDSNYANVYRGCVPTVPGSRMRRTRHAVAQETEGAAC